MGTKGDKHTRDAAAAVEQYVSILTDAGEVTSKKMFGGYGLFEKGVMFGLVNSAGELHFRVDESTQGRYEAAGAAKHGKMPYFQVPVSVLESESDCLEWAREAISVAHRNKK